MNRPMIRTGAMALAVAMGCGSGAASAQIPGKIPSPAPTPSLTPASVLAGPECKAAPAMWVVEDDDSQVWIMGVPSTMPRDMPWSQSCVRKVLEGARKAFPRYTLRTEPMFLDEKGAPLDPRTAGPQPPANMKVVLKGDKPPATTLESRLAPDVLAAFEKGSKGLNSDRLLSNSSTAVAAEQMYQRGPRAMNFPASEPNPTIARIAAEYHVPLAPDRSYSAEPVIAALALKPEVEAQACLKQASDLEWVRTLIEGMAKVWSVGDLPGLQAEMKRGLFRNCLRNAGRDQINRRGAADFVSDATEQLKTPGKVFMMIGIDPLLADDGALNQLKQKGFKVVGAGYAKP